MHYHRSDMTGEDAALIRTCELELLDPIVRRSAARLNELIAEDFFEIGRSGRTYTKKDALDLLPTIENPHYALHDLHVRVVALDTILVTFRLEEQHAGGSHPVTSMRSSLWQKRHERWQIVFHQGTPLLQ
jgi:hypothetical protein